MTSSVSETIELNRSSDLILILNTPKGMFLSIDLARSSHNRTNLKAYNSIGRGVFAKNKIPAGQIIETCPVLVIPKAEDDEHIRHTVLYHYTYNWPSNDENGKTITTQAVIFGLGSMFNHSINQNVGWERDINNLLVRYKALRDINKGEELCISYGSRLTFKDAEISKQDSEEEFPKLDNIMMDT